MLSTFTLINFLSLFIIRFIFIPANITVHVNLNHTGVDIEYEILAQHFKSVLIFFTAWPKYCSSYVRIVGQNNFHPIFDFTWSYFSVHLGRVLPDVILVILETL